MNSVKKRVLLNSSTSFIYQAVTVAYGFIIPRLIITHYGSDMNGWLTSIVKYLSLISICEFGIGAVVKANLYKPLLEKDKRRIEEILKSANSFFYKIGLILLIYTVALMIFFPHIRSNVYGTKLNCLMIIAVSLGTFSQYFFGVSSQLLLEADQKAYIPNIINIFSSIAVTVSSYILINKDFSLLAVRFAYAFVYSIRPVCIYLYATNKYKLDLKEISYSTEPIKQKWNGFTMHVAQMVQNNTDTIVLSIFSVSSNVSIYSVYHLVTNGLHVLINILSNTLTPVFGRFFASGDTKLLRRHFDRFEWFMHCAICILYGVCSVKIVPFIKIYTRGVSDANYIQWDFGVLSSFAIGLYCITQLYLTLIYASGNFRETQKYIIIEPIINIITSIIAVGRYGLIGVMIGTIISLIYKLVFLIIYLKSNIIFKEYSSYLRIIILDVGIVAAVIFSSLIIPSPDGSYFTWLISAFLVAVVGGIAAVLFSCILYRDNMKWLLNQVLNHNQKKM